MLCIIAKPREQLVPVESPLTLITESAKRFVSPKDVWSGREVAANHGYPEKDRLENPRRLGLDPQEVPIPRNTEEQAQYGGDPSMDGRRRPGGADHCHARSSQRIEIDTKLGPDTRFVSSCR